MNENETENYNPWTSPSAQGESAHTLPTPNAPASPVAAGANGADNAAAARPAEGPAEGPAQAGSAVTGNAVYGSTGAGSEAAGNTAAGNTAAAPVHQTQPLPAGAGTAANATTAGGAANGYGEHATEELPPLSGTQTAAGAANTAANTATNNAANTATNNAANTAANPASPAEAGSVYGTKRFWGQPGFETPTNYGSYTPSGSGAYGAGGAQGYGAAYGQAYSAQGSYGPGSNAFAGPLSPTATKPRKARKAPGWGAVVALSAAMALGASGATAGLMTYLDEDTQTSASMFSTEDNAPSTSAPVASSSSQNPDWEKVATAVRPTVVAISVTTNSESDAGSGVILDTKGHILTNNHVVAAAASGGSITVQLYDGRLYDATITGRDVMTDLAVIQIKNPPKDLTAATLGDSDDLKVGQSVVAIGNPLGLSSTVTTGIVSALDRPVTVEAVSGDESEQQQELNPFAPFGLAPGQSQSQATQSVTTNAIQVDAAINPGNSGGPLFDAQGRVIGINSSIASLSGSSSSSQAGSIGLGFAIPINQAEMVATQLIENGTAQHAFLGVTVTPGQATVDGVTRMGAKVASVESGSAASGAGLRVGDVVVGIDGHAVSGSSSLTGWVRRYPAGTKVTLQVVRDSKELTLTAELQARTDS